MADYELDFDNLEAPQHPSLAADDSDAVEFTPDTLVEARALSKYSVKTILAEIITRSASIPGINFSLPESQWPASAYISYCSLQGAYGKRMVNRPLGELVLSDLAELSEVHIEVLQAAITTAKITVTSVYTDATLAVEAAKMRGVTVTDLTSETIEMRVPGCSTPIHIVKGDGPARGRVIAGGAEFVRWHNLCHNTVYTYMETDPLARSIAFAAFSLFSIKDDKGSLVITARPKASKTTFRDLIGTLAEPIMNRQTAITKILRDAWDNPLARAPMTRSLRDRFEALLTRHLETMNSASRQFFGDAMSAVEQIVCDRWDAIRKSLYLFAAPSEHLNLDVVRELSIGKTPVCGKLVSTMGAVRCFVEESRIAFRDDNDLARKSDSVPQGFAAGAATSVAEKIQRCIESLRSLSGVGDKNFSRVDAYGTGAENHMSGVIERAVDVVTYYDINKNYSPKNGGQFFVANVELLEKGSGKGKYIFDDTFNGPENTAGATKFNASKKIEAILRADYDGGFAKLYYGAGEEAGCKFGTIPPTLAKLLEGYNKINLIPGGSVHTPEYFVVFHKDNLKTTAPPRITDAGYGIGGVPCNPDDHPRLVGSYIKTWLAYRAAEILRANLALNVQVAGGCYRGFLTNTKTGFNSTRTLLLGGSNVVGSDSITEAELKNYGTDVSFLDEDVVDSAQEHDVGMLGSGNSKGDGPIGVICPRSYGREEVRKAALKIVYDEDAADVRIGYPDYHPSHSEAIFAVRFSTWTVDAPPPILARVNAVGFPGAHFESMATEGTKRFRVLAYVPPARDRVVCMYLKH